MGFLKRRNVNIFVLAILIAGGATQGKDLATHVPAPSATAQPLRLSVAKDLPLSAQPFWRTKEAIRKKVMDERAVVVSVTKEDRQNGEFFFSMKGAGLVSAPKNFSFQVSQNFSKLKEVSDHFKTVEFDPDSRKLFIITEALGYQARMILLVTPVSEDWRSELQWRVIWGSFQGMTGVIGFEEVKPGKTEISLFANYQSKVLPLPKILMGFALEIITQKVAEKMRTFIETQFQSAGPGTEAKPKF